MMVRIQFKTIIDSRKDIYSRAKPIILLKKSSNRQSLSPAHSTEEKQTYPNAHTQKKKKKF